MKKQFLFLVLCFIVINFQIYPIPGANISQVSSRVCQANCYFCQTITGQCQQCLDPYFVLRQGRCIRLDQYSIDSSINQDQARLVLTRSWISAQQRSCQYNISSNTRNVTLITPRKADQKMYYRRQISTHKYIAIKFALIRINWNQASSLEILIKNQLGQILSNQTITGSVNKAKKEQLCSDSEFDERFALFYRFKQEKSRQITVEFKGSGENYGISSMLFVSGRCNKVCQQCQFSERQDQCIRCKNFIIKNATGYCNLCQDGFSQFGLVNEQPYCKKCPIQFQRCQNQSRQCFYDQNSLVQLDNKTCKFMPNTFFSSEEFINQNTFSGSLFEVAQRSSSFQCGIYSMVGLAQKSQSISRIFTVLKPHLQLSITFNVFKIDQSSRPTNNIYILTADGVLIQRISITMAGQSNVCSNSSNVEILQTFPPTNFFNHVKTRDVNITVLSDSTNWGLRNLRIAYKICDESCAQCSENGCLTCQNLLQLVELKCNTCLFGSGKLNNNASTCLSCSKYCKRCTFTSQTNSNKNQQNCLQCVQGYFVYEEQCQKHPNAGNEENIAAWSPLVTSPSCDVSFSMETQEKLSFQIGRTQLSNNFTINQKHNKLVFSFYLIKIDKWDPNDRLDLYINDLLVLSKTYGSFGNHICFRNNQTDFISFQEFSIEDSNTSVSAHFIIEGINRSERKFGVANFRVLPMGCENCQNYDFNYKVQYNFDKYLNVQIIFNRIYLNTNAQEFKTIFELTIAGQISPYSTVGNNSIRYLLKAEVNNQTIGSNITIRCKYPLKITTNINNNLTPEPLFETSRRKLQNEQNLNKKPLETQNNFVSMVRYTPPQQVQIGENIAIFFSIISGIVIYGGFISFLIGCQTPCTHFMHNLQKLWLHIYVAALFVPALFRITLIGFRQTQNQNIAINPFVWEKPLPTQLYYNAPSYYQQYYPDITFFRNIYSVGLALLIFLVFTMVAYMFFALAPVPNWLQEMKIWRHLRITFYRRLYFVINSIFFYQYITACFACALQFIDIKNRTYRDPFNNLNAAAAIIAFIFVTVYPITHFIYLRFKAKDMYDTGKQISYRNRYHQIFYRFQPPLIWKANTTELIPLNFTQRLYNFFRFFQIWFTCLIIASMNKNPFPQTFILIVLNLFHLIIVLLSGLSYTKFFRFLKVLQLLFFIGIEVVILISVIQVENISTNAYQSIGNLAIAFTFIIVILSIIRYVYTFYLIYREYDVQVEDEKKLRKIDWRLRNEEFYESLQNGPISSEQENI